MAAATGRRPRGIERMGWEEDKEERYPRKMVWDYMARMFR
jgi:hypothetical protein